MGFIKDLIIITAIWLLINLGLVYILEVIL